MSKKLVVFGGSQEIADAAISEQLLTELEAFLRKNKDQVAQILFGGGKKGVMGQLLVTAQKVCIPILGCSLECYREDDGQNDFEMMFFPGEQDRMAYFAQEGDQYLALPGGAGTLAEVFGMLVRIKESDNGKTIIVPAFSGRLHMLLTGLENDNMFHGKDKSTFMLVESLAEVCLA